MAVSREYQIEKFERSGQWDLLPTLVWIATRDIEITYDASRSQKNWSEIDVRLTLLQEWAKMEGNAVGWHLTDELILAQAWDVELAPALAKGKIKGTASSLLSQEVFSGKTPQSEDVGQTFPPTATKRFLRNYTPRQIRGRTVLVPSGPLVKRSDLPLWVDVQFPSQIIRRLWDSGSSGRASHISIAALTKLYAEFCERQLVAKGRYPGRDDARKWSQTIPGFTVTGRQVEFVHKQHATRHVRRSGKTAK